MSLQTRQPTGKPPWPIVLIAGAEKAGKSYSCAQASGSDLIGRTFWVGIGEDDPDEYGAIPGARFEIVVHDGTYKGIGNAIASAVREPMIDGKPNLIVLDSATRLWEMISDMAQAEANQRAADKARKYNRPAPAEEARIDMDLWNRATDRWHRVMDLLRGHHGPSLVTARLDVVTVLDDAGKPTKQKDTKIKAQKSLPYDVGVVIEMHTRGETYIMGARSLKLDLPVGTRAPLNDFTVDGLWRNLGLAELNATAPRQHSGANVAANEPQPAPGNVIHHPEEREPHQGPQAPVPGQGQSPIEIFQKQFAQVKGNRDGLKALGNWARNTGAPEEVINQIKAALAELDQAA